MGGGVKRPKPQIAGDKVKQSRSEAYAARKARNKETKCTTVKRKLNTLLTGPAAQKELLKTALNDLVEDLNLVKTEGSLFLDLHVTSVLEAQCDDPVQAIGVLDQTFCRRCLSVAAGHIKQTDFEQWDQQHQNSLVLYRKLQAEAGAYGYYPAIGCLGKGFLDDAAQQMETNLKNYCLEPFWQRVKGYVMAVHHLSPEDTDAVVAQLKGEQVLSHTVAEQYRHIAPRQGDQPQHFMPFLYLMLQHSMQWPEQQRADQPPAEPPAEQQETGQPRQRQQQHKRRPKLCRLFSMVPLSQGYTAGYIKVSNTSLWSLLKRMHGDKAPTWAEWTGNPELWDETWRKYFDVAELETKHRTFAREISTDGDAVSVLLRMPAPSPEPSQHKHGSPGVSVSAAAPVQQWGLDPGLTDLVTGVASDGATIKMSTKQYRAEARITASASTRKGWNKKEPWFNNWSSQIPTSKTTSVRSLSWHIVYVLADLRKALAFHMRKPFRMLRFRAHIMSQKTISNLCSKLVAVSGPDTVIGLGDWGNQDPKGIFHKPRGPVKQLHAALLGISELHVVDEYRTSKLHFGCHALLPPARCHKHPKGGGVGVPTALHQVRICRNRCCPVACVHRDQNAARNILEMLKLQLAGLPRPLRFQRGLVKAADL